MDYVYPPAPVTERAVSEGRAPGKSYTQPLFSMWPALSGLLLVFFLSIKSIGDVK